MALIWVPMCLSLFCEAHGMCVAIYLSKPEQRFLGRVIPAWALNIVSLAFYISKWRRCVVYELICRSRAARSGALLRPECERDTTQLRLG
jgi:hypothetical protein